MTPRHHAAEALREAEAPIGLALPDDPIAGIVKPQQWHQATIGRRRSYLSAGDARAYEAGWRAWPDGDDVHIRTPFADGFFDREKNATVLA